MCSQGEDVTRQIIELYSAFEKYRWGQLNSNDTDTIKELRAQHNNSLGLSQGDAVKEISAMCDTIKKVMNINKIRPADTGCTLIDKISKISVDKEMAANHLCKTDEVKGSAHNSLDKVPASGNGYSSDEANDTLQQTAPTTNRCVNADQKPSSELDYFHTTSSSIDSGYKSPEYSDYSSGSCYGCSKNSSMPRSSQEFFPSAPVGRINSQKQMNNTKRLHDSGFYDSSLDLLMYLRASLDSLQKDTCPPEVSTNCTNNSRPDSSTDSTISASSAKTVDLVKVTQNKTVSTQTNKEEAVEEPSHKNRGSPDALDQFFLTSEQEIDSLLYGTKSDLEFYDLDDVELTYGELIENKYKRTEERRQSKKKKKQCKEPHSLVCVHNAVDSAGSIPDSSSVKSSIRITPCKVRGDNLPAQLAAATQAVVGEVSNDNGSHTLVSTLKKPKKQPCMGRHVIGVPCGHMTSDKNQESQGHALKNQQLATCQNIQQNHQISSGNTGEKISHISRISSSNNGKLPVFNKPKRLKQRPLNPLSAADVVRSVMGDMEKLNLQQQSAKSELPISTEKPKSIITESNYQPAALYHIYEEIPDWNHQPNRNRSLPSDPPPLPERPPTQLADRPECQKPKPSIDKIKSLRTYIGSLMESKKKDTQYVQELESRTLPNRLSDYGFCEMNDSQKEEFPMSNLARQQLASDLAMQQSGLPRQVPSTEQLNSDMEAISGSYNLDVTGKVMLGSPFKREMIRASLRVESGRKAAATKCRQNIYSLVNNPQYRQSISRHLEDEWKLIRTIGGAVPQVPPLEHGVHSCHV